MASNISAIFQGILTLTDNTQSNALYTNNIDLQNPTVAASQIVNDGFLTVPTSPGVTLAYNFTAYLVLIWNRGTNNIQINGAVSGGPGVQELAVLGPGDVFSFVSPSKAVGYNANGIALIAVGGSSSATVVVAG